MVGITRCLAVLLLLAVFLVSGAWGARAEPEVDLALVLAVDVSRSMESDEQELQRQGFVEAFRSPQVHNAIHSGMLGRIAVAYVEWSSVADQEVLVPWTVMEQPEDALGFAERLAQRPLRRGGSTSISGAIDFGIRLLAESGVTALRQVIDVSGDGANNQGRIVTHARDDAITTGITINGLPILLQRATTYWDIADLDLYFRDCVIGGVGAFMIPVRERSQFTEAIKTKIIREIATRPVPKDLIEPVQADARANCLAGEIRRNQRWGN